MIGRLTACLLLMLALVPAWPARSAAPLVADLSKHLVAITTGFAGTEVLLFGAVEETAPGKSGDVVVVVRGPTRRETVRRKDRQAGIWMNAARAEIDNAPAYYRVAATRPLQDLASPAVLARHEIGLEHLGLDIRAKGPGADPAIFRQALMRLKQEQGLYSSGVGDIDFLSHRLFRTDVAFPANVPVGTYLVQVYLIQDGKIINTQTTPLVVSKIGLGADVYDFAHRHAALYGIIAIILAVSAGWLAAATFRR